MNADLEVINSTISTNGTSGPVLAGGGIYNVVTGVNTSFLVIEDSSIVDNQAQIVGGGVYAKKTEIDLHNSILGRNSVTNNPLATINDFTPKDSVFFSPPSYNLIGSPTEQHTIQNGVNHNKVGYTNAQLGIGSLSPNGGFSPTHALLTNSPAIDAGDSNRFIDQRGIPIIDIKENLTPDPDAGVRDIGAFELEAVLRNEWQTSTHGSLWGSSPPIVLGFGFSDGGGDTNNDGKSDSSGIKFEPEFFGLDLKNKGFSFRDGIDFGIAEVSGSVSVSADLKFGIEVGAYFNSGTVDVDYSGGLTYVVDQQADGDYVISTAASVEDGSLYTISPRFGFYINLVAKMSLTIGAYGEIDPFIGPTLRGGTKKTLNILDTSIPLLSVNAPKGETRDPNVIDQMDGEIKFLNLSALAGAIADGAKKLQDASNKEREADINRDRAKDDLNKADSVAERTAAQDKLKQADTDVADSKKTKKDVSDAKKSGSFGSVKSIVSVEIQEAEGDQLGIQANLGVGIGGDAGGVGLGIGKTLGSVAITIPDVVLTDTEIDKAAGKLGVLTADTDDFVNLSDEDLKRQIARLSIDLAAITGFGGTTDITVGPAAISITPFSYMLNARLLANQFVEAVPSLTTKLKVEPAVAVQRNGQTLTPDSNGFVTYAPGDELIVSPPEDGSAITVTPQVETDVRFQNKVGLDLGLDGVFEAIKFSASLFDYELFSVGPLIGPIKNDIARLEDFATLFDKTFDLPTASDTTLTPFTLGEVEFGLGSGAGNPWLIDGNRVLVTEEFLAENDDQPFFMAVPTVSGGNFHRSVEFDVERDIIREISVLQDGITLQRLSGTTVTSEVALEPGVLTSIDAGQRFRLVGFDPGTLADDSTAIVAVRLVRTTDVNRITTTLLDPVDASVALPALGERPTGINRNTVNRASFLFVERDGLMDIDGDGEINSLTDGVLLTRFMANRTGTALTAGALGVNATRTNPADIITYIQDNLITQISNRLDPDADGQTDATTDGVLITRALAGFTGANLTGAVVGPNGTRTKANEILDFVNGSGGILKAAGFNPTGSNFDSTTADIPELQSLDSPGEGAVTGSSSALPYQPVVVGNQLTFPMPNYFRDVTVEKRFLKDSAESTDQSAWTLLGIVPVGSPAVLNLKPVSDILEQVTEQELDDRLVTQTSKVTLGIDQPLFIRLPDAEGYLVEASTGFTFAGLHFNPNADGNKDLAPVFDIHLLQTDQWLTVSMTQILAFPAGTTRFEIYGRQLPDSAINLENLRKKISDLDLRMGVTLLGPTGTAPTLTATAIGSVPRPELFPPEIFANSSGNPGVFRLVRQREILDVRLNNERLVVGLFGRPVRLSQIAAVDLIFGIPGSRGRQITTDETLIIDLTGGPIYLPIDFNGGGGTDTLVVDGAGFTLDLTGQFIIHNVEMIDIRGSGANQLMIDVPNTTHNSANPLLVRRDADDAVRFVLVIEELDEEPFDDSFSWTNSGDETIGGITYEVFVNGTAVVKVEKVASGRLMTRDHSSEGFAFATPFTFMEDTGEIVHSVIVTPISALAANEAQPGVGPSIVAKGAVDGVTEPYDRTASTLPANEGAGDQDDSDKDGSLATETDTVFSNIGEFTDALSAF